MEISRARNRIRPHVTRLFRCSTSRYDHCGRPFQSATRTGIHDRRPRDGSIVQGAENGQATLRGKMGVEEHPFFEIAASVRGV